MNGSKPSPAMKPSPALEAAIAAKEFVPGKLDLGSAMKPTEGGQEGAKQASMENGTTMQSPSKMDAMRPPTLAVATPASAPVSETASQAQPFTGRVAGKVKVEVNGVPLASGKRYSLRVMKMLGHDQKYLDMEHPDQLKAQIESFRRLLDDTPELDPAKDMPDRKQADGGRGTPRGGPGTPKSGRGKNKNDVPLRDKSGKIIEIKALEISENRWKPTKPTDDEEKVYKAIKGVLNKLTLEKFEKLYEELLNIGITSASLLRGFVVILYDKAVLEPNFLGMYAQMCERLSRDLPELSDEDGVLPFGEVLVGKCRSEFEIMGKEPERETMGELSAEDKEHKLKKLRQRTLGNVEFIGELFKKKMVGAEELEELLQKLFETSTADHDNIQPLCKLLESVGKPLEATSKEKMDAYFERIQGLAGLAGLSSRYKFMLLDLKDLRAKDWVPRRAAQGPQTLEAVKKEVDKENRFVEKPKDKEAEKKKKEKEKEKKEKAKKKEAAKNKVEDDGWAQVGTPVKRNAKGKSGSGTNSPLTLSRNNSRENLAKKPTATRGGFAALMMDSDDENGSGSDDDDDDDDKSGSEEEESEEEEAEEEEGDELDEEGENKVGGIMREYLSIHDKEEAKLCMQELYEKGFPKGRVNVEVVRAGLMQAMDAGEKEGELVGNLLCYLVKEEIITDEAAAKGFVAVLSDLPDITIDVPLAPKILSAVLVTLMDLDFVSVSILAPALKSLQEADCPASWKHFEKIQESIDA